MSLVRLCESGGTKLLLLTKSGTVLQRNARRALFSGTGCDLARLAAGHNAPILSSHIQFNNHGSRHKRSHGERGYKNFGHKPEQDATFTKIFGAVMVAAMFGACLDWKK